jgi:hypothetical protein
MGDAFLGGERSGGKPVRSSENKISFVVAVECVGGKPHRACMAANPHHCTAVAEFCDAHICRPATMYTDGLGCFGAAQEAGVDKAVVTVGGRSSARHERFQGVNIYLGNLKSAITGTFCAFKFAKHAPRYFAEFQLRFNHREDLPAILIRKLHAALLAPSMNLARLRALETAC